MHPVKKEGRIPLVNIAYKHLAASYENTMELLPPVQTLTNFLKDFVVRLQRLLALGCNIFKGS